MNQNLDMFSEGMSLIKTAGRISQKGDFSKGAELVAKAAKDHPLPMAFLAVLQAMGCGVSQDEEAAVETFIQSAMIGFLPAIRGLAVILISRPETQAIGGGLLRRVAQAGDWIAAFVLLREACRGRFFAHQKELEHLSRQLSSTVPFRDKIHAQIQTISAIEPIQPAAFDKEKVKICVEMFLQSQNIKPARQLHSHPQIISFSDLLTPLECDYLMAMSVSLLRPSKVVDSDAAKGVSAGFRTSYGAVFGPGAIDLPIWGLLKKLSHCAEIRPEHGELLSILRYLPGQEYLPHHDYLVSDSDDYSQIDRAGQRHRTLLTYLNSGYDGGETEFPTLNVRFKGTSGAGLRFDNTAQDGSVIEDSLHAGLPIIKGEKWLATLWCRERPFWPWAS